jgi:hypothetical protein
MNILTDALPVVLEVDGKEYPIHSDFRACIRTVLAWEDNDLTNFEKQSVTLSNLYRRVPKNIEAALKQANWFFNGGNEIKEDENGNNSMRFYSFGKDAQFIFSAFRQTHGIDLETAELHWWKFLALFMDLGADTTFCNLVSLRKRIKTGKATKEEKQAAREMGDLIEIEEIDTRTLEEKEAEAEFMRRIEGK